MNKSRKFITSLVALSVVLWTIALLNSCSFQEPTGTNGDIYITTSNGTTGSHNSTHMLAGDDVINVLGLQGLLANDQHVLDSEVIYTIENVSDDLNINVGSENLFVITSSPSKGVEIKSTSSITSGAALVLEHDSVSPAVNDVIGQIKIEADDSSGNSHIYGLMRCVIVNKTHGTESGKFTWLLIDDSNLNEVMWISSNGTLHVDAGYTTFDLYDDAKLLKESISEGDYEKLYNAGIFTKKYLTDNDGQYVLDKDGKLIFNGYMMKIQQFAMLSAGGVIQNREKIDELQNEINLLKIEILELKELLN